MGKLKKIYSALLKEGYAQWLVHHFRRHLFAILLILLLEASSSVISILIAVTSKHMIDNAVSEHLQRAAFFTGIFVLLVLANILFSVFSSLVSVRAQEKAGNDLRQQMFSVLTSAQWQSVSGYHSGDILTRMTSDLNTITGFVMNTMPSVVSLFVRLCAAFVALYIYEPRLAVLAFILGPFTVLLSRIWGRKLKKYQKLIQSTESQYRSVIQEAIQNMLIVKTFQLERRCYEKIQSVHEERLGYIIKRNRITLGATASISVGYWTGYILAFSWGIWKLSQKATTFGTMTAFLQLVEQIQGPFISLSRQIPQIVSVITSVERVQEIERIQTEKEVEVKLPEEGGLSLVFDNVSFSYDKKKTVIENINVQFTTGDIVGIIGSSGEGKTTLIRLLQSLIRPDIGELYLVSEMESHTRYEIGPGTRKYISYVPQGNTLFSGSIIDNLRFGNRHASEQQIWDTLQMVDAFDFVNELPEGIHSKIGEHGIGLSEGQAQRLAIARALLKDCKIMILDEATSSLDPETEKNVLRGIRKTLPECICIVITHRMSVTDICNKIFRLNSGGLEEMRPELKQLSYF